MFMKCQNKHNNETHSLVNDCENETYLQNFKANIHTHHISTLTHTSYIIRIPQTIESFGQFLKKRQKWWNSIERKGSMRRILGVRLRLFPIFLTYRVRFFLGECGTNGDKGWKCKILGVRLRLFPIFLTCRARFL